MIVCWKWKCYPLLLITSLTLGSCFHSWSPRIFYTMGVNSIIHEKYFRIFPHSFWQAFLLPQPVLHSPWERAKNLCTLISGMQYILVCLLDRMNPRFLAKTLLAFQLVSIHCNSMRFSFEHAIKRCLHNHKSKLSSDIKLLLYVNSWNQWLFESSVYWYLYLHHVVHFLCTLDAMTKPASKAEEVARHNILLSYSSVILEYS